MSGGRGVYVAVALALGLAYFGAVLVAVRGAPVQALQGTLQGLVPGVVLAWLAVRAGRRARWFDGSRRRVLVVHAILALGFATAWNASVVGVFAAEHHITGKPGDFKVRVESLGFGFFTGLLIYASLAGAAFGVETSARLRDAETLRVRAELAALRAQLNPHFLFNTLHTVLGLVRRDPALAEEALQDLGDVLRYALQRADDRVALREELEIVRRYLAIERVRLGERLRVVEEVAPEALETRLPAFTLQPLVENAVRYAVVPRAAGGRVTIGARVEDGALRLTVVDDGPPADPDTGGAGVGLTLVRQRLRAACGPDAELSAGRGDGGFVVDARVPQ